VDPDSDPEHWVGHIYLMKKSAGFWFGLRGVGILYSRVEIQGKIDISPAFLKQGTAEKFAHANSDPNKQEVKFI
jgi:hypothetical protein